MNEIVHLSGQSYLKDVRMKRRIDISILHAGLYMITILLNKGSFTLKSAKNERLFAIFGTFLEDLYHNSRQIIYF